MVTVWAGRKQAWEIWERFSTLSQGREGSGLARSGLLYVGH